MKKRNKKIIVISTIVILIICLIIGLLIFKPENKEEVKVIKSIDGYGYNLNDNETKLYKEEFDNLYDILSNSEVNYEEYAKSVSKLFIIDFYTLDNKLSKNDIGGVDFIKESMRDNFIEQARSTFYKYLEVKSEDRNQNLPIVSKINDISIENTSFTYADKTKDENAYKVTISWEYKEELGYEKTCEMLLVRENEKLYIVEMN